jgi:hypothetical protein
MIKLEKKITTYLTILVFISIFLLCYLVSNAQKDTVFVSSPASKSNELPLAFIAGFFSLASLVITLLIKQSQNNLHKLVNSRMTEMLELTKKAGELKGQQEGKEQNQAETDAKPQDKK